MKNISSATGVAIGRTITRPMYFIEIDIDPPTRFCTFDTMEWNGLTWSGGVPLSVSGIGQEGVGPTAGTIEIGNLSGLYGALVLQQRVIERSVRIWVADAEAVGDVDPVFMYEGVISSAEVSMETVVLALSRYGSGTMNSPRRYVEKASGFSTLIPAGTKITLGGEVYTLERRK